MVKYVNPEMEIMLIDTTDIILASTGSGNTGNQGGNSSGETSEDDLWGN